MCKVKAWKLETAQIYHLVVLPGEVNWICIMMRVMYTSTGDSVWRQGKERDLLCVRLGCGNWLWCRRFLISSLWWIIADGCHKVHVFWETFNPGRKSGMGYYLLFILMVRISSSSFCFSRRMNNNVLLFVEQILCYALTSYFYHDTCYS